MRYTPEEFEATGGIDYEDWSNKGNTLEDYKAVVAQHGKPLAVWTTKYMICAQYWDVLVVFGYDGNEYFQEFIFNARREGKE